MKKLLLLASVLAATSYGGLTTVRSTAETPKPVTISGNYPVSVIDGIAVPFEVDMSVQMTYQGYAITAASTVPLGSSQAYRLRIERNAEAATGFYLLYSLDWQPIGRADLEPAPTPPPVIVQQQPEPEQPQVGGRGGDEQTDEVKPEKPDKPDKPENPEKPEIQEPVKPQKPHKPDRPARAPAQDGPGTGGDEDDE